MNRRLPQPAKSEPDNGLPPAAIHTIADLVPDYQSETCLPIKIRHGSKFKILNAVIDIGLHQCIMPAKHVGSKFQPCHVKLTAANGTKIDVAGQRTIEFEVDGIPLKANFIESNQVDEVLISREWLFQKGFSWDFGNTIKHGDICVQLRPRSTAGNVRRVFAAENTILQPRSCGGVKVCAAITALQGQASDFLIEPCTVNDQAVMTWSLLSSRTKACLFALNPSDDIVHIKRGQHLTDAHAISPDCVRSIECVQLCNEAQTCQAADDAKPVGNNNNDDVEELIKPLLSDLPPEFTPKEVERVRKLLYKYHDLFARH
jgi:hypothetical protein